MAAQTPDRYFARVSEIDIQRDLIDCGYTNVLLDMDNTLVSRQSHDMPLDVRAWIGRAREAGVALCILSNNWHRSPYEWGERLNVPVVAKACKPLPHGFLIARGVLGARSADTVVIGDQLLTDVVGAHLLGMAAYLVCPLATVDLKHTQILRSFESVLMGGRQPETAMVDPLIKEKGQSCNS